MEIITPNKYVWKIGEELKPYIEIIKALSHEIDIYPIIINKDVINPNKKEVLLSIYPHSFLEKKHTLYKEIKKKIQKTIKKQELKVLRMMLPHSTTEKDINKKENFSNSIEDIVYFEMSSPIITLGQTENKCLLVIRKNLKNSSEYIKNLKELAKSLNRYNEEVFEKIKKKIPFIITYREKGEEIAKTAMDIVITYLRKNNKKYEEEQIISNSYDLLIQSIKETSCLYNQNNGRIISLEKILLEYFIESIIFEKSYGLYILPPSRILNFEI